MGFLCLIRLFYKLVYPRDALPLGICPSFDKELYWWDITLKCWYLGFNRSQKIGRVMVGKRKRNQAVLPVRRSW